MSDVRNGAQGSPNALLASIDAAMTTGDPSHRDEELSESAVSSARRKHMGYIEYLRTEALLCLVVGGASIVAGWPGVFLRETAIPLQIAIGFLAVIIYAASAAVRNGSTFGRIGTCLCPGSLPRITDGQPSERWAIWFHMAADGIGWLISIIGWIVLCRALHLPPVLSSGALMLGIGVAVVALGILQATVTTRRITEQIADATTLFVSRRRPLGFGYPRLTLASPGPAPQVGR